MATLFRLDSTFLYHHAVNKYLPSISINSHFAPTPRGIFDLRTLYSISISCDILFDPLLFRAIFLTSYFAFLRMSNIAPHSAKLFGPSKHILRQDLVLKWTKTLQDHKAHHIVQIPSLSNNFLCPVRALSALFKSRVLPPSAALFASNYPPFAQVNETHVRDALKRALIHKNIPLAGHGFHTFRSGATLALDNNVPLQNIQAHGLWQSSAVWTYLHNASLAPSIIPSTFCRIVQSTL